MKWIFVLFFLMGSFGFVSGAGAQETKAERNKRLDGYADDEVKYDNGGGYEDEGPTAGENTAKAIGAVAFNSVLSAAFNANRSHSSTKKLGAVSAVIGGFMIKKGHAMNATPGGSGSGTFLIVMGTSALQQGLNALLTAKQNKKVEEDLGLYDDEAGLAEIDVVSGQGGPLGGNYDLQIKKSIDLAKNNGVFVKDGNVHSPDKSVSLATAGNPNALGKAFGLDEGQIATIQKDIDKIKAKVLKKYGGVNIGLAGRGGSSRSGRSKRVVYEEDHSSSSNSLGKKRYLASIRGLTKKFGDSMIGVKGDNIFEMIHRSYRAKKTALLQQ